MKAVFGLVAAAFLFVAADLVIATGAVPWVGNTPDSDELLGRSFVSVSVTEYGQPRSLVADTRVRVSFNEVDGETSVGWSAGCNGMGSSAAIHPGRIRLVDGNGRGVISTLIRCTGPLASQDEWIRGFFEAGPRWELHGERLRLAAQAVVIEFVEADDG